MAMMRMSSASVVEQLLWLLLWVSYCQELLLLVGPVVALVCVGAGGVKDVAVADAAGLSS